MSTTTIRPTQPVRPRRVADRNGSYVDFARRCQATLTATMRSNPSEIDELRSRLLDWATDERMLRTAWDYLAEHGGQAPGPNGRRYGDLSSSEIWRLMRALRDSLRAGRYRPAPPLRRKIPKSSGQGHRVLRVQNIEDRVIARAIKQAIEPLLEATFDEQSYGFRPGRDRVHALARATSLADQGHCVWVVDDIRNAFDQVPLARLRTVLRSWLPDEVLHFGMAVVAEPQGRRGLIQGSPLSPLLMNAYLDRVLDRPWRRRHADVPLIRTADDILLLCRDGAQAADAYQDLDRLLRAAGMPVKGSAATAIHDLRHRSVVATWLGFAISLRDCKLVAQIGDRAWRSLALGLAKCHERSNSPLAAAATMRGWISQAGPCYDSDDRRAVCRRLRRLAATYAFDEAVSERCLLKWWRVGRGQWQSILVGEAPARPSAAPNEADADEPSLFDADPF